LSADKIKQAEATTTESERLDKALGRKLYEMSRLGRSKLSKEERKKNCKRLERMKSHA
jgi:hypothetical protein